MKYSRPSVSDSECVNRLFFRTQRLSPIVNILAGTLGVWLSLPGTALALSVTTFVDRSAWESATPDFALHDFNTNSLGQFESRDFGAFVVTESSSNVNAILRPGDFDINGAFSGNIDGTPFLEFQAEFSTSAPLTVIFHRPVSAFGFDYVNNDASNDISALTVIGAGQIFQIGVPLSTGFFGLVIDGGTVSQFEFRDTVGGGGALISANYDNFRYSLSVPLPPTVTIFVLGLLGIAHQFKRRRTV